MTLEEGFDQQAPEFKLGPEAEEARIQANAVRDKSDLESQLQELRSELKKQQAQEAEQLKVLYYSLSVFL